MSSRFDFADAKLKDLRELGDAIAGLRRTINGVGSSQSAVVRKHEVANSLNDIDRQYHKVVDLVLELYYS